MITKNKSDISRSEQVLLNKSVDDLFDILATENMEFVPANATTTAQLRRKVTKSLQQKIVVSGDYTYICLARPGTPEAGAYWQIKRIDTTGNILYADANDNFDNVASDPTGLTYAYS